MNRWVRYTFAAVLVFCLILVRKFETDLFDDPFLSFFKGDYLNAKYPEYDFYKLALNIFSRYLLNSSISLLIIGLIFWDSKYVVFSGLVYAASLIILLPIYLYFVETEFSFGVNMGFFIRRLLIQPVILLVLIPAFYYQKHLASKQTVS